MPIFEYVCRDCSREFEAFVTGERKPSCPACQGDNLGKLLSRPGMVGATERSTTATRESFGGCGAGGASCACRANMH